MQLHLQLRAFAVVTGVHLVCAGELYIRAGPNQSLQCRSRSFQITYETKKLWKRDPVKKEIVEWFLRRSADIPTAAAKVIMV